MLKQKAYEPVLAAIPKYAQDFRLALNSANFLAALIPALPCEVPGVCLAAKAKTTKVVVHDEIVFQTIARLAPWFVQGLCKVASHHVKTTADIAFSVCKALSRLIPITMKYGTPTNPKIPAHMVDSMMQLAVDAIQMHYMDQSEFDSSICEAGSAPSLRPLGRSITYGALSLMRELTQPTLGTILEFKLKKTEKTKNGSSMSWLAVKQSPRPTLIPLCSKLMTCFAEDEYIQTEVTGLILNLTLMDECCRKRMGKEELALVVKMMEHHTDSFQVQLGGM